MATLPTLQSTTLEGALLEVTVLLQQAEAAATPPLDRISLTFDADAKEAVINATLPINYSATASGVNLAAQTYV